MDSRLTTHNELTMDPSAVNASIPKTRRRVPLSPGALLLCLIAAEGFLWASERWRWFAFNENKGCAVLIAVVVALSAILFYFLWLVSALLFRWRFQFSVRSLLMFVFALALPCAWLASEIRSAEKQRKAIQLFGRHLSYDFKYDSLGHCISPEPAPPAPRWLVTLLGVDFFANLVFAELKSDDQMEHLGDSPRLRKLFVGGDVSNVGMRFVAALTELEALEIQDSRVTDGGMEYVKALTRLQN